ncbi:uncharacterized protein LOC117176363 [Belonocnema kinseyi]|uniref:uncharacterized protein LOC117176363 n=1 Tax=Belonocnema kinseyi TaxID=2817044 RepID=UPI00143DB8F2|nr:uncharacterized protein LOC117176363 [Belonocnema kinseyi]
MGMHLKFSYTRFAQLKEIISLRPEEVVDRSGATDGLMFHNNQLYFIDSWTGEVCSYHVDNGHLFCATTGLGHITFVVPIQDEPQKYLISYHLNNKKVIGVLNWNSYETNRAARVNIYGNIYGNIRENTIAGGTVDPHGVLWFWTMETNVNPNFGNLYSFNPNLLPELVKKYDLPHNSMSNGIVWHLNNPTIFYYIDVGYQRILSFTYNKALGTIYRSEWFLP